MRNALEGKVLPLAFLADIIAIGCHANPGLHQDSVYLPTIFYLYFCCLCSINFIGFPILHVKSNLKINDEITDRPVSL